eukprot:TRINITY_DN11020_c0_g1_i1.p1 TRINITY_DN11020_c0_g1~~TRINITY_DN11020_c0_g1_i1.p1  ORF type:complete len:290 (+),score=111.70 TRINITY_DN11020_c0_g1_i1:511-1380(+)
MDSGPESSSVSPRVLLSGESPDEPLPAPSNEDGYLGDCSSDGGNEKNFPMPSEVLISSRLEQPDLSFKSRSSRKMKGPYLGGRSLRHSSDWGALKASLSEKKLRSAAGLNDEETLQRLLKSTNPNASDGHKRTGLHIGAAKGYARIVSILLEAGADPNQKDALGNTALHLAACTNHIDVVTLLLRAGTDVSTLDNNGRTPMQLAQSKLKILQKNSSGGAEMSKVKTEVAQVLDMMREYLTKSGINAYDDLLNNFSSRFNLHQTVDQVNSDLQDLLDSLGNLSLRKGSSP